MRGLIDQLPLKQRQALILRHTEHLSYREMAKMLGVTVKGLKSLLFQGKKDAQAGDRGYRAHIRRRSAMKHEDYVSQIYALLDNFLTPEEEVEVREHMETCESCKELYEKLMADDAAAKESLDEFAASDSLRENVMESIDSLVVKPLRNRWGQWVFRFAHSRRFAYAAAIAMVLVTSVVLGASVLKREVEPIREGHEYNGACVVQEGQQLSDTEVG